MMAFDDVMRVLPGRGERISSCNTKCNALSNVEVNTIENKSNRGDRPWDLQRTTAQQDLLESVHEEH